MPAAEPDPPSNVTEKRQPVKRKRETPASRLSARSSKTGTPNAYSRRSPPRERDPVPIEPDENDGDRSPPRKLKRPGASARVSRVAIEERRRRQEEEEKAAAQAHAPQPASSVAQHYNLVPERGREWRKTDSAIKGLRSLNNWVKSTLIQKFSRPEMPVQQLCVLDMACGKGGDLGKWEKAPQVPSLYVGCDIADVSIEQARQRYAETMRRNQGRHRRAMPMQAEFFVHDTFGRPVGEIPIIQQVGFNPGIGPGPNVIQGGSAVGGFDVVSMMFALHYSFENETLARGMLKNVAGALKKGGRFIGVMPNSDVITAQVKKLLSGDLERAKTPNGKSVSPSKAAEQKTDDDEDDWDPEKTADTKDDASSDWDPEKPSADDEEENWDPEKPSETEPPTTTATNTSPTLQFHPSNTTPAAATTPASDFPPLEWGNDLYHIKFPHHQPLTSRPLPKDGLFRPPFGWRYHYTLSEAVDVPEYVVPWEALRALAEDYGLELLYRKGFREILEEVVEGGDRELGMLAERMGVLSRDRTEGRSGVVVGEAELEAAAFYHGFCFYKT